VKLTDFFSLQWWVSVGIAAVLWSIINDAVKRGISRLFGLLFKSWGDRNAAAIQKLNADAAHVLRDREAYARLVAEENTLRQKAIYRMLWGMFIIALPALAQLIHTAGFSNPISYWPFSVPRAQVGPVLTFMVALLYIALASQSWLAAQRCNLVLRRADSIRPFIKTPNSAECTEGIADAQPEGE
jgi:hypothetical protein